VNFTSRKTAVSGTGINIENENLPISTRPGNKQYKYVLN